MSILDLHGDDLMAAASRYVKPPKPEPKFSAWSLLTAVPRGSTEAVFQIAASASELAQAPAKRRTLETADGAMTNEFSDVFREAGRDLRPDPETGHVAEQVLYQFARGATKIVGGFLAAGPIGVLAAGAEEANSQSDDLRRAGVDDLRTRATAGAAQGAGLALAALPVVGTTATTTAALYLAGGPGGFVAQQALTREVLQSAGYEQQAQQFDPLDPLGLAVATLVPAPFVALGVRNQRAAAAARAAEEFRAGPVPSEVTPTAAAVRQAIAPEVVDAARVTFGLERRASTNPGLDARSADRHEAALSQAEAQLARGEPVEVRNLAPAAPTFAQIEADLRDRIAADFDQAARDYAQLPDAKGGKVLNTDTARELSPYYLRDRTQSAAVHEPASQFIKDLYARKLAEAPGPGEENVVMFTAGGTGAGKTTAIDNLTAVKAAAERAQLIYDTNMNGYESSRKKIEQALDAGKDVHIVMVARDPEDALVNGALPRAENQRRKFGTGRTVPLAEHIKTHIGAVETIRRLAKEYAGEPRVRVSVVDNSLGKGKAVERPVSFLDGLNYNGTEQRVRAALERERENGTISAETYRGFAGAAQEGAATAEPRGTGSAGQVPPGAGAGVREGPEPRGDPAEVTFEGPIGLPTTAVTERGLTIPLRYRLADVASLTTSHTNDLTANPAFPAELQPRDRARAASAEQISRIENGIRPELLGESVKASDGAPIVGPDAVVESGNARTIALRRAYDSGKADAYRAWLADNAERFGLTRDQVLALERPVLVRERLGDVDRAEFARQANESAVAAMSPTEQAMADARRITDLSGLVTNEDGTINPIGSAAFVRQFIQQAVAPTERGGMLQANGQLSQSGLQRVRNAVFAKAYGDADLIAMLTESTDANVRNILAGMLRAAPEVAKLADLASAGARQDADIAGPLVQAVRLFSQLRSDGMTVPKYLAQGSMFDDGPSPELAAMLEAVAANSRAPKRVAEMITDMVDAVHSLGDTRQVGMFDDMPTSAQAVTAAAQQSALETRLAAAGEQFPGLEVMLDGMDKPMPLAEFMAQARAEAAEAAADAPLMQVAAECAILNGV